MLYNVEWNENSMYNLDLESFGRFNYNKPTDTSLFLFVVSLLYLYLTLQASSYLHGIFYLLNNFTSSSFFSSHIIQQYISFYYLFINIFL